MFALAFFIGIYSYLIFSLGILGLLFKQNVQILTIGFFLLLIIYYRKGLNLKFKLRDLNLPIVLIIILSLVNLVGALGPELGFDALWYHLTLPKIYLASHHISHIPGGLFYYSDMPKLIEMLYVGALSFGGETITKLTSFSFGILSTLVVYKISRKLLDRKTSAVACLFFYSSLVVDWISITSYIDLGRTFFEGLSLLGFLNYVETKKKIWLLETFFVLGLAISSKLLSLGSIAIFAVLLLFNLDKKFSKKIFYLIFIPLFVASPWFVFSFINTGNPVYPFFTNIYKTAFDLNLLNPAKFISDLFDLFIRSHDPINPFFIVLTPLLFLFYRKMDKLYKTLTLYALLSLIIWYITPQTGGGRFMLAYLPAFSVLAAAAFRELSKDRKFTKLIYSLIVLVSIISIMYRGVANAKYLPVLLGREPKEEFLSNNLNFSYGDFYDTDGFLKRTIKNDDKVLLYGFHNIYYADFPFIDSSYVKTGDKFNFIATQNSEVPDRFKFWKEIYFNQKTGVKLYSFEGKTWLY